MPKVDFSNYLGREQAFIKHSLLGEYLPDWAYKVGGKWDSLTYVDAFAGPWQTKHPNFADSSFGIAVDLLRRCQNGLRESRGRDLHVECILVEQEKEPFEQLRLFAADETADNFAVRALRGSFAEQIPAIEDLIKASGNNPFRFVFLDPKGWADIPMAKIQPLLNHRSCEVLITLMTRHIVRFLDQPDREESYRSLFGRDGVIENLRTAPFQDRVERAVNEYSLSLKMLCNFKYVSSALILEPNKEAVRYYLMYGTNHPRGIEVFKVAENKASRTQDDVRQESRIQKSGGQLEFPSDAGTARSRLASTLWHRYLGDARKAVMKTLLKARDASQGVRYEELFCEAMAFPLVSPDDLVTCIRNLEPHVKITFAESERRRKPSPLKDDRVVVVNAAALRELAASSTQ